MPRFLPSNEHSFALRPKQVQKCATSLALVISLGAAFPTMCLGQNFPAGAILGAFNGIMNQAVQQQQQQQRYQQQLYYQQQQQQQQTQRYQQQQLDFERHREANREYQEQQQSARERTAAQRRQRDAAIEAAREKARAEAEVRAKAEQETRAVAQAEAQQRADAARTQKEEEDRQVRVELVNALVVDGRLGSALGDITVLVAARDTPHVIRNLSGDPMFVKPAAICFPFDRAPNLDTSTPDGRFLLATIDKIMKKGGNRVNPGNCTLGGFGSFDLLVFSRKQIEFTDLPTERIKAIIAAIREDAFVKFDIYLHSEYLAEAETRREKIDDDERLRARERTLAKENFRSREDQDVSAIYTKSPAPTVCLVGATDTGLTTLLTSEDSPYLDVVPKASTIQDTSAASAIFLALKTHDCLAAVGPTKILREVITGLDRDGILFEYHPKSIPVSQVSKLKLNASAVTNRR
jgi:cell shape-determining protein MreC